MQSHVRRLLKFYERLENGKSKIVTWKVNNLDDAKKALQRARQKQLKKVVGYYTVWNDGTRIVNIRID